MSPILSEILLCGFTVNSALRRRTHLVQSFSVVFLYWFYTSRGSSMASGTSSGSSQLLNPHSEADLNSLKKLKRKISNRESARRSRMRKQRHLGELTGEVSRLRREKSQLTSSLGVAKQLCAAVEAESSVLRAQVMELGRRLQALTGILGYAGGRCRLDCDGFFSRAAADGGGRSHATAWSSFMCTEQPVKASAGNMLYH